MQASVASAKGALKAALANGGVQPRSGERLFEPVGDAVAEKAVRRGDEWGFCSTDQTQGCHHSN